MALLSRSVADVEAVTKPAVVGVEVALVTLGTEEGTDVGVGGQCVAVPDLSKALLAALCALAGHDGYTARSMRSITTSRPDSVRVDASSTQVM